MKRVLVALASLAPALALVHGGVHAQQVLVAAAAVVPALALVHGSAHTQVAGDRRLRLARVEGKSDRKQAPNVPVDVFEGGPGSQEFESVRTLVASFGYGKGGEQESTYESSDEGPSNHMGFGSMGSEFRFMDDLEPVAPMDRLGPSGGSKVVEIKRIEDPGNKGALAYVPPGMFPDAFPVVNGPTCLCSSPNATHPNISCACDNKTGAVAFRWTRTEPVYNSSDYKLIPADLSYPDGDYWHPQVPEGNVISPEDKLPKQFYPLQARADKIRSLPAFAKEDRVPRKFAKYFDQVEARSTLCDTVSPECTTSCVAGDEVQLNIGNVVVPTAVVVKAFVGNTVTVKFIPGLAAAFPGGPECKVEHGCSSFRSCYLDAMETCTESKDSSSHDWQGNLLHSEACPEGSKACATVEMLISATMAEKEGKACKAALK